MLLKGEHTRTLERVKAMRTRRPGTQLPATEHSGAIADPLATATKVNRFLGGGLDIEKMAAAVDPGLHRNRARA